VPSGRLPEIKIFPPDWAAPSGYPAPSRAGKRGSWRAGYPLGVPPNHPHPEGTRRATA
jgi:hypothetical protein